MLPSPQMDTPNKGHPNCLSRQEVEENFQHKRDACRRLERQLTDLNGRCAALEQENHELTSGLKLARQMEAHYVSELDELERSRKAMATELKQASAAAAAATAAASAASPEPPTPASGSAAAGSAAASQDAALAVAAAAAAVAEAAIAELRAQLHEANADASCAREAEAAAMRERYELEHVFKSELRHLAGRLAEAEEAVDAARTESALLRERLAERESEAEALLLEMDAQRIQAAAVASGECGGARAGDGASAGGAAGAEEQQLAARGNSLFAELEDRRVKAELLVVELQRAVQQLRDRLARKDAEATEMRRLFSARMQERTRSAPTAEYVADLEQEAAWSRQQIEALQTKIQLLETAQDANQLQCASVRRTFERTCGLEGGVAGLRRPALGAAAASSSGTLSSEARMAECQSLLRSRELECCSLRNTKLEYSRQLAQLRSQLEAAEQRITELELQLIRQRQDEAEFSAMLDASTVQYGQQIAADESLVLPQHPPVSPPQPPPPLPPQPPAPFASAAASEATKQWLQSQVNYPPQMLELMRKKYNRN